MKTEFHGKLLSDYALSDTVVAALGHKSKSIGQAIAASKFLAPVVDRTLVPPLDESGKGDPRLEYVIKHFLQSDLDRLKQASRIMAIFTQAWHFEHASDGKTVRLAAEYSGVPDIVPFIRRADLPFMEALPPLEVLNEENLDEIAQFCLHRLVGLIPVPLLQRYAFQFPMDAMPMPLKTEDKAQDINLLIAIAGATFFVLTEEMLELESEDEVDEEN